MGTKLLYSPNPATRNREASGIRENDARQNTKPDLSFAETRAALISKSELWIVYLENHISKPIEMAATASLGRNKLIASALCNHFSLNSVSPISLFKSAIFHLDFIVIDEFLNTHFKFVYFDIRFSLGLIWSSSWFTRLPFSCWLFA